MAGLRHPAALPAGLPTGRSVRGIGAGTCPGDDPRTPVGNGRAVAVLAVGEGASVACADVSPSMVAEALREVGSLDALVVNVGIGLGLGLAEVIDTRWTARPRPGGRRVPPRSPAYASGARAPLNAV
ncbi:hypothetical protein [Streptomyces luteogriseus]|uniref:hypothetical protein n=1 Tax=Streptomyces luteogriseus TaxID=68233 RepID=UPI00382CF53F